MVGYNSSATERSLLFLSDFLLYFSKSLKFLPEVLPHALLYRKDFETLTNHRLRRPSEEADMCWARHLLLHGFYAEWICLWRIF
jgi:hypothetical protein